MAMLFFIAGFLTESGTMKQQARRQRFFNNTIMLLVALVTLVNIVISTFSNKVRLSSNETGIPQVKMFVVGARQCDAYSVLCGLKNSTTCFRLGRDRQILHEHEKRN